MIGKRARSATCLTAIAALLPLAMLVPVASSAVARSPEAFAPPARRLLLTRELRSPLADGKVIVARRVYAVEIRRDGDGFRVDGQLMESAIDAPASLRSLAELERNRPDTGLFPIRLNAQGRIQPLPETAPDQSASPAVAQAAAFASDMLRTAPLPPAERARASGFVARLASQPATTPWPSDLFHPEPGLRVEDRPLTLPNSAAGTVTIETDALAGSNPTAAGELVCAMRRTITTRVGGDRRTTREEWTLRIAR